MGMKSFGLRQALLMSAAAFGLSMGAAVAPPAYAQEATRTYDIPSQDLDDALREFGRQTGRDVLFTPDAVAGKRSGALVGQMTERQALESLLAGSGLRFEQTASGGYAVQDPTSPTRLGDAGAASSDRGEDSAEILVVGRRTLNADIRRSEDDTQPYVIFDQEEIENSGAYNVESFLRDRLPMSAQQATLLQQPGISNAGQAGQFNLRGLGTDQTLVLIDGRRVPGTATGLDLIQGNINGIPPSAIERIEVLPSTAAGIYGGGATGGVINIILKREYSGLIVDASYGVDGNGGGGRDSLSAAGGLSLNDGATRLTFAARRSSQDALQDFDRSFVAQSRTLLLDNNPASFWAPTFFSNRPNIFSAFGDELVLDPSFGGSPLGSSFTSTPEGYRGPTQDGISPLVSRAGELNLTGAGDSLLAASTIETHLLSFSHQFSRTTELFVSLYRDDSVDERTDSSQLQLYLAADDATNPFQQDVYVNVPLGPFDRSYAQSSSDRAQIGLVFPLVTGWRAGLEYNWSLAETSSWSTSAFSPNGANAAQLEQVLFADRETNGSVNFLSLADFISSAYGPTETTLENIALRFSGPLFRLPGGPAQLSSLIEQRSETVDDFISTTTAPTFTSRLWRPEMSRDVQSYYVEVTLPFVSASNDTPFIRALELTGSVRRDDYTIRAAGTSGVSIPSADGPFPSLEIGERELGSTDFTLGLRYEPNTSVAFRASYGTGFQPPGLSMVSPTGRLRSPSTVRNLRDPRRGNGMLGGVALINFVTGGALDLEPEESEAFSLGTVLTPTWLDGLRLSIDVTDIRKTNEFWIPTMQYVIDNEASFAGRIGRAPNLATDPPGWAGPIDLIDTTAINVSDTHVRAVDIQLDYSIETSRWGTWQAYAIATQQTHFVRRILPTDPSYDSVGYVDGPLEWRGNFGLNWSAGSWDSGFNAQYFDSYSIEYSDPSLAFANAERLQDQGTATVRAQILVDAFVRYELNSDRVGIDGLQFTLGIQNVFDEQPEILAASVGTISGYSDPIGRRFLFTIRKAFGS